MRKLKLDTRKVVIFNGPPGSGKDLICDMMCENRPHRKHVRFKDHLFKLTMMMYNVDEETFYEIYNNRELKEKPMDIFGGKSIRQAMIFVSEVIMKPHFGKEYFGKITAKSCTKSWNFISDGGFNEEILEVASELNNNILVIRLHRAGCDFSNDSRDYLQNLPYINTVDYYNNSDNELQYLRDIKNIISNNTERE
jgi:hypothetical protein